MEPATRVAVTVTFLSMGAAPRDPVPRAPAGCRIVRVPAPTVPFYRYLYAEVGGPYLWWLRRVTPDAVLADLLGDPAISIHVLYRGGEPAGFFELDRRTRPDINLSYFGLLPHAIGRGLGRYFLRAAVEAAWAEGARTLTVNTCTADHPRALPNYLAAGFRPIRSVREVWDIPHRLGLQIPHHLRV